MNKLIIVSLCALVLAGCTSAPATNTQSTGGTTTGSTPQSNVELTVAELAEFDGTEGRSCYVAVSGTIYDLSDSAFWQDGVHSTSMGQASCGRDLTTIFETQAPSSHKISNYLGRYPVVGKLV